MIFQKHETETVLPTSVGIWCQEVMHVQGVAWDPASEFVISQSADRTCRYATLFQLSC